MLAAAISATMIVGPGGPETPSVDAKLPIVLHSTQYLVLSTYHGTVPAMELR